MNTRQSTTTPQQSNVAPVVPVRLRTDLLAQLDEHAKQLGTSRSTVIRAAIREYLARNDDSQAKDELLTAAVSRKLDKICSKYGVQRLEVFGSVARGQETRNSDIDLLYTLHPEVRLGWDIEQLADQLSDALGRRVDLVGRGALHPHLRDAVLSEAKVLYES